MNTLNFSLPKLVAAIIGILWASIEPTLPFLGIALFAMLLDIYSAYRLNCRIKKKYGKHVADGKLKSASAFKALPDMCVVFCAILLAHGVETQCFPHMMLYLPNYVCAGFCAIQMLSILENTSSCNNAPWARIAQRFVANKISRHLDITPEELERIIKEDNDK